MTHHPVAADRGMILTVPRPRACGSARGGGAVVVLFVYGKYTFFERTRISFWGAPSLKVLCGSGRDVCWMFFFFLFSFAGK
jgi:hypothetical protein